MALSATSVGTAFVRRRSPAGRAALLLLPGLAAACAFGGAPGAGPRVTVTPPRAVSPAPSADGVLTLRVGIVGERGVRILDLPLEDYVLAVVRAELPSGVLADPAAAGMLEVQAIVSRTFAIANLGRHRAEGFDVCGGTHCQVLRPPDAARAAPDGAARAVAATRSLVIAHEGRAIQALFHAACGGHTASGASVWGGSEPYLAAVPDSFCSRLPAQAWTCEADGASLARALASSPAMDVGTGLARIDITERDVSGRVTRVALTGSRTVSVRAEAFRGALRTAFGERSLRSTRFTVAQDGRRFIFPGTGLGHGEGLCQAGALERILAGVSPADVIAHYFPGTRVMPADGVGRPAP